jgi:hypothetical protein
LADTGKKWLTTYKISNGGLTLAKGEGIWWWYGTFTKNVVKPFHENDTSDASFLVAKQLRDSAAALFFYDGNNVSNVKEYHRDPPHPYADRPANHMWNIVTIDNRIFVIDATYFDMRFFDDESGIVEVKGEI